MGGLLGLAISGLLLGGIAHIIGQIASNVFIKIVLAQELLDLITRGVFVEQFIDLPLVEPKIA